MPLIKACPHCGQKNRILSNRLTDSAACGACKSPIPPANEPIEAGAELFDEILQSAQTPVLVDFWAPWCGPCRMTAPEVARTAADMSGRAIVLKVNTEEHPELGARYNIRSIPNFIVFRDGRIVMQQAGAVSHEVMEQWLNAAH